MTLRDLAAQDARLALAVDRFVTKELEVDWRGSGLVVALSGGADSTALLVLLCALREYLGLTIAAAHLDHALRPESRAEAEAASALCVQLDVPFFIERCDVAALSARQSIGLEEAGRQARYKFLEQVRCRQRAQWIVTAHHVGDLAEDVLLRLVRGASWPGLGGMQGRTEQYVLRPLLMVDKSDLIALLQRQHIGWQEDSSNASRDFRRNRIRLDVLPLLLAENPDFYDVARQLWRSARLDAAYWSTCIEQSGVLQQEQRGVLLARDRLQMLTKPGRIRAYAAAIKTLQHGQARASTLFALDEAWEQRHFGKFFQFPDGVLAKLSKDGVYFTG